MEHPVTFYMVGPDREQASVNGVITDNYAKAVIAKAEHPSYQVFKVEINVHEDDMKSTESLVSALFNL